MIFLKRVRFNVPIILLVMFVALATAPTAMGQARQLRIDYTVEVASVEDQLFHVTATLNDINQPRVDISLPVWTPGWYTIENYAKNILRFKITGANGERLPHLMTRKQTWSVNTEGHKRITVEFDYRARTLALNQAKISTEFAFFTGTQLFVMAEGHRKSPSTVRFIIPQGWKIVSALKETADPMTFSAPDYDTLLDSPTEMGNFDLTKFDIKGKPHYFVATPAGTFSKEKTDRFTKMLTDIALAQGAIFGDLPYEKFVYFYFFARPESNAGGAVEHNNSFVAFAPPGEVATPEMLTGTASHEFFHVWNVKRIRPIEMWPYDYSRENESPLLWVSEGFTNYYTNVALYRAGLRNREQLLLSVAQAISGVENNPARAYISPADSSTSTWLGYDTPVAFGISYYTQGQNLGALLDLSILNDTSGASGLDDVMRALYNEFYKKGKGFSIEDLILLINRITHRDYNDFFRRYVRGVEVPPYDQILSHAGYHLEEAMRGEPDLGIDTTILAGGEFRITRVSRSSSAGEAGLMVGDILLTIGGVEARRGLAAIDEHLGRNIGETVKVNIKRGGADKTLDMHVKSRSFRNYKIVEVAQPTPKQLKVREAWLKKGE